MKTDDPRKKQILESLKGGLIVSCQVQHDDPIYTDNMVVKMAEAARWAVKTPLPHPAHLYRTRHAVGRQRPGAYRL